MNKKEVLRKIENRIYQREEPIRTSKSIVSERNKKNVSNLDGNSQRTTKEETKNSTQNIIYINSSHHSGTNSKFGESEEDDKEEFVKAVFEVTRINKKTKKVTKRFKQRHIISHCEHIHARYYAKGMCKKCYFSKGQTKKLATK